MTKPKKSSGNANEEGYHDLSAFKDFMADRGKVIRLMIDVGFKRRDIIADVGCTMNEYKRVLQIKYREGAL